jgi:hypothetical protein
MPIGDDIKKLFKGEKERAKDRERARRKAFREAEGAIDTVKDRIASLKKDRDKAWIDARNYLKDGQKAASQRSLQTCRASEIIMSKIEIKRWVFEQLLTKLELAKTDQDFTQALKAINTVVHIDPESVTDILDEVQEKLGEQVDVDKVWEKMHGKEMEGVETQMTDIVPSVQELEKQLEDEVAAELGRSSPIKNSEDKEKEANLQEKIGEGRKRLKELLEEDK